MKKGLKIRPTDTEVLELILYTNIACNILYDMSLANPEDKTLLKIRTHAMRLLKKLEKGI